jgi:hypothetical protein
MNGYVMTVFWLFDLAMAWQPVLPDSGVHRYFAQI